MSNLSDLLPAGGGAKVITATASGNLATGQTVVLNSNGTVAAITETSSSTGTPVNFNSGSSRTYTEPAVVYHPVQDKTVFFFRDSGASNYGKAIVGTVSDTAISFSGATEYTFESGTVGELTAVYDSNIDRIVVVYENSSNYTEAKVVTVSGNTLSFSGASGIGSTTNYEYSSVCFDSSSNKIIFAASSQTNSAYGHARVLTATTSSVSSGTVVTFESNAIQTLQAVYDVNANKTVIAYNKSGTGAQAIVGTVSGTDITFGSAATVSTSGSNSYNVAAAYDSDNNKVVVAYRTALAANDGNANVGTVSGTSISFGSAVQYLATSADHTAIVYDATAKKMVIAFADGNSNGQLVEGTVSGNSISFTSPTTYQSGSVNDLDKAGAYDSTAGRTVFSYQLDSNKDDYAFVHQAASTTADNFVGITNQAINNSASGEVVVEGGVITNGSLLPFAYSGSLGSAAVYETAQSEYQSITFDSSNNRVVVAYNDDGNSSHGTAAVGTVSGTSISWGTPVVYNAGSTRYNAATFDSSNNKVVIAYADIADSEYGKAVVGTVSGTSISFGSEVTFESAASAYIFATFDTNSNKAVIMYRDDGNSQYLTAVVGTVSGTSISFGTPVVVDSTGSLSAAFGGGVFDSTNNKVVIPYSISGGSTYGIVGTVSGTSISFGTRVAIGSVSGQNLSVAFDSNAGKVVINYRDGNNSDYTGSVVGTVSGTSISFGTESTIEEVHNTATASFDNNSNVVVFAYKASNVGYYRIGTVSGTSISYGSASSLTSGNLGYMSSTFDSNQNTTVVVYRDASNSNYGTAKGLQITGAVPNLTIGSTYYVQDDGTLSTTSSSVTAGKAIANTTLLLKG